MIHWEDYEREADRDYIYQLERQKDIEASWQQWEQTKVEIIKHRRYETNNKSSSFRRTSKKILLLRSRLLTRAHRATV